MAEVPGVKLQEKGRLATRQGYYCLGLNIDTSVMGSNISLADFIEAVNAEGVTCGKTYGPVYGHMLWNLPDKAFRKIDCSIADCVCENHGITMAHSWLLAEKETIVLLAKALKKVALNIGQQ